jgi:hypothetical protein
LSQAAAAAIANHYLVSETVRYYKSSLPWIGACATAFLPSKWLFLWTLGRLVIGIFLSVSIGAHPWLKFNIPKNQLSPIKLR